MNATATAKIADARNGELVMISTAAIVPSPLNPRKNFPKPYIGELAASIAEKGIQQPLTVRLRIDVEQNALDSGRRESYEIVTGECRWRGAKQAGLAHVPCLVREMDDGEAIEAMLVENSQRRDVSPIEEAQAYQLRLKVAGDSGAKMTVAELAKRVGKAPRTVYDRLELLKLGADALEALEAGFITASHAAELLRLEPTLQAAATHKALEGISVMGLRMWISDAKAGVGMAGRTLRKSAKAAAMPTKAQKAAYERATQFRRRRDGEKKLPTAASLAESYSAGVIPEGRIHAPYEYEGSLWVCVGMSSQHEKDFDFETVKVVPRSDFRGTTRTYDQSARGRFSRGYHGVRVRYAGRDFVLSNPRREFAEDPATLPPSLAEIERAISGSLPALRVASLKCDRKRGEWIAVLRTPSKPKAKARRAA